MIVIVNILILVLTFVFMECVAWFTHKYIMHGFLWVLHEDHHKPNEGKLFEKNDYFFLIFAVPGITFLLLGLYTDYSYYFWIGLGITMYGFAYFFIHDLFIHQRLKVLRNTKMKYFRAVRKAHKVHHKNTGKHNGECFGMLWFPKKYFKEIKKS